MPKPTQLPEESVDLVLSNLVSRLGCTVKQARELLARQAKDSTAQQAAPKPTSKGSSAEVGEALL